MIFRWVFPNPISAEAKWLATYVALSRTPSLALLRSFNLTPQIRAIIEQEPPVGIVERFHELPNAKLEITAERVDAPVKKYNWH